MNASLVRPSRGDLDELSGWGRFGYWAIAPVRDRAVSREGYAPRVIHSAERAGRHDRLLVGVVAPTRNAAVSADRAYVPSARTDARERARRHVCGHVFSRAPAGDVSIRCDAT